MYMYSIEYFVCICILLSIFLSLYLFIINKPFRSRGLQWVQVFEKTSFSWEGSQFFPERAHAH
jgi:hypothetical protein